MTPEEIKERIINSSKNRGNVADRNRAERIANTWNGNPERKKFPDHVIKPVSWQDRINERVNHYKKLGWRVQGINKEKFSVVMVRRKTIMHIKVDTKTGLTSVEF